MKKKHLATFKDKKDWIAFTKQMGNINAKESDLLKKNVEINKVQKIDLHGSSLIEANEIVKNSIIRSFNGGYKKLLVVTGKGLRSKSHYNPYLSEKLSMLKYSVPEYLKKDENLKDIFNNLSLKTCKEDQSFTSKFNKLNISEDL